MDITLRQMEYVVAVADEQFFGRAADACHVSQPALSRQVKQVEEFLGTPLFERTRKGAMLTPAGREFVEGARTVLNRTQRLITRISSLGGELRGQLKLGVIPTIAPYLLPGVLGKLHDRHADLELTVIEDETSRLIDQLGRAQLDAALMATPVDTGNLEVMPLIADPFLVVFHADHPLSRTSSVPVKELTTHSLLLLEEGHCFRDHALEFCASAGKIDEADVRSASLSTLLGLVELGRGVTVLPTLAIARELPGRPRLVARPLSGGQHQRTISLVWRSTSPRFEIFSELGQLFADHIEPYNQSLDDLGYRDLPRLGAPTTQR